MRGRSGFKSDPCVLLQLLYEVVISEPLHHSDRNGHVEAERLQAAGEIWVICEPYSILFGGKNKLPLSCHLLEPVEHLREILPLEVMMVGKMTDYNPERISVEMSHKSARIRYPGHKQHRITLGKR